MSRAPGEEPAALSALVKAYPGDELPPPHHMHHEEARAMRRVIEEQRGTIGELRHALGSGLGCVLFSTVLSSTMPVAL